MIDDNPPGRAAPRVAVGRDSARRLRAHVGNRALARLLQAPAVAGRPELLAQLLPARGRGPALRAAALQRVKTEVPYRGRSIWYESDDHLYYERNEQVYTLMNPQPRAVYLVGEGNFEYSRLLQRRRPEWIVKATEYEAADAVFSRQKAKTSLVELANHHLGPDKKKAVDVIEREVNLDIVKSVLQFNVDATNLSGAGNVSPRRYDELRWIFPHAGGGASNPVEMQAYVDLNGPLLTAFFLQARQKLRPGGFVKIALKQTPPYYYLDLFAMAKAAGFQLVHVKGFKARQGFTHSRTGTQKKVPAVEETSYKFQMLADAANWAALPRPVELPAPPPVGGRRAAVYTPVAVPAVPAIADGGDGVGAH
jgi:hypothetical protein